MSPATVAASDPFLRSVLDKLHDSAAQRRFHALCPMPVGVVFIEAPGMSEADIRHHFRTMKQLGITCLKQFMWLPGSDPVRIANMALDEGIIPFWFDTAAAVPTRELLEACGLSADADPADLLDSPRFHEMYREQMRGLAEAILGKGVRTSAAAHDAKSPVPGMNPQVEGCELPEHAAGAFVEFLKRQYGSVEALKRAWNMHHTGIPQGSKAWERWEDVEADVASMAPREYGRLRDILRFRAHLNTEAIRVRARDWAERFAHVPTRAGGEMGLFLPFASRGTNMEHIADAMREVGSFYPSIHMAWHFEEVGFEIVRPVYMQASIAADWFKGGWSATWESTGGPQHFSGGKAHLFPEMEHEFPGCTVHAGTMTQLMLSYLAAGFRGFGLWCWNPRTAGWEAGEYSLCDRNHQPTERAVRVGQIGKAATKYRREIWNSRKEPVTGILVDWDNEAIWASMSQAGRGFYKHVPVRARIGASRALINANVPWEYVTPDDLAAGLAGRYKSIYLPSQVILSDALIEQFEQYCRGGGNLIMDMPGGYFGGDCALLPTAAGSPFERLFGAILHGYQYARNARWQLGSHVCTGFTADLTATTARVAQRFTNGQPAVTQHRVGHGHAFLIAADAAQACQFPGNGAMESLIVELATLNAALPFTCRGAICYRLAGPTADHYFLLNDGPETTATLSPARAPMACTDAVTGEQIDLASTIYLEAESGRWLRCTYA